MATCCQNSVTPAMIKKGRMEIGDKILFEEEAAETFAAAEPLPGNAVFSQREKVMYENSQAQLPYDKMTGYADILDQEGSNMPYFGIPTHPMVPPEYGQTIDYESVQYMNGFLRTQIGRGVRVQQLIGSGNTVDRYGFLVGVGNNYLLLQDISNGNIMLVDFYTVKYVYIYYSEPVFPSFPASEA